MLSVIKGDYYVGIYAVATKIVKLVISAVASLSTVILPRVSYYYKSGRMNEYKELLKRGVDFLLLFSLPASVGLAFASKAVVLTLLGAQYADAVLTLRILGENYVFESGTLPCS